MLRKTNDKSSAYLCGLHAVYCEDNLMHGPSVCQEIKHNYFKYEFFCTCKRQVGVVSNLAPSFIISS